MYVEPGPKGTMDVMNDLVISGIKKELKQE